MTRPLLKDVNLSENARYIAVSRYGMKGEDGQRKEGIKDIFWRVASNIGKGESESMIMDFYNLMAEQKFLPNTPCLVNAGKKEQQLSACFVLPIEDSMESILVTMRDMAMIHKSGGGTGFSFSRLRPYGDYIASSGGTTVGPVSFMQAYNDLTSQVKQGGVRRGANMGMLNIDHPDVLRFAVAKLDEYSLTNFNISLAVSDAFMKQMKIDEELTGEVKVPEEVVRDIKEAQTDRDVDAKLKKVEEGVSRLYEWAKVESSNLEMGYDLINPRTGQSIGKLNAFKVFKLATRLAWQYGDPGLVFIDRMNDKSSNPVPKLGRIEATNPCGEQPLLPYDACNLGSINLAKFVTDKDLNWPELARVVNLAVRFLDNVVEVNKFPLEKIREMVGKTRRIGLGVMGFADMLFKLKVAYDSKEGVGWAEKVMKFISDKAKEATVALAMERGVFEAWGESVFSGTDYRPRNMALTTIAPTGTISIVGDASSGIEPVFSLVYKRNTVEGKTLFNVNPVLIDELKKMGMCSEELMEKIADNGGKLGNVDEINNDLKKVYRTALEISPEWHIKIQAAFQKYVDNAVSKTVNFPKEAKVEDVENVYRLAYELGTKGVTIYRSGSREKEVMVESKKEKKDMDLIEIKRQKKKTPEVARGLRMKKSCDVGNVYTSVFFEAGDGPVEIFVTLGKSGGYMAGGAEVTGRLASLALKYGATLEEVAEEMVGISCGQRVGIGNMAVLSMYDAVGKSLFEISRGEQLRLFEMEKGLEIMESNVKVDDQVLAELRLEQAKVESHFSVCPDCGSQLYAEEGCFKCSNAFCGYSKCS